MTAGGIVDANLTPNAFEVSTWAEAGRQVECVF
jgi:hypothetical protein